MALFGWQAPHGPLGLAETGCDGSYLQAGFGAPEGTFGDVRLLRILANSLLIDRAIGQTVAEPRFRSLSRGGLALGHGHRQGFSLPDPDVIAEEIVEDLQAALDQFAAIATDLSSRSKA